MMGIFALLALTTAGSLGVRRYLRWKRAAAAAEAMLSHVTPDAADRSVTIVDNGGTPFVVRLSYKRRVATVYLVKREGENEDTTSHVFRSFRYKRAFIGLDPEEREAERKNAKQRSIGEAATEPPRRIWWYGGNTVLLDMGERRYMFIGLIIFTFTAYDDILDYVSTMGNNAVPYPFAVGVKNTYCMIEDTYIPNHIIKMYGAEGLADPYRVLYSDDLCRWLPGTDPKEYEEGSANMPRVFHSRTWSYKFKLKDYERVLDRQW